MGTIAQKLEYLNGTKQKLKQAINNLGGDITSETTFRNYVEELEGIYDNLPKTDYAEGTEITLSNTLKGKLDYENNIVGYGDTQQDTYSGKNLYPSGTSTQTIGGITFTPQENGSIKVKGTSTYANYYVAGGDSNYVEVANLSNKAENMVLSVSGMQNGIQVYVVGTNLGVKGISNVDKTLTFTTTLNDTYRIFIRVVTEYSVDTTLYIQLEKGNSVTSFEKYVGGTASPNPSYPQEIEVVRGKNLFDSNNIEQGAINAIVGSTYAQCKTSNNTRIRSTNLIPIVKNTDYTISFNSAFNVVVQPFDNSGKLIDIPNTNYGQWKASAFTINTGTIGYIAIAVRKANEGNIIPSEIDNVTLQLEKGSQATSYLPYNTVEIEERGINLLNKDNFGISGTFSGITITNNEDGSIILNGTSTAQISYALTPNPNYYEESKFGTYSYKCFGLPSSVYSDLYYGANTYGEDVLAYNINTLNRNYFIRLIIPSGITLNNVVVKPMLVKGSYTSETFPEYQPYILKTYQLSLGEYEFAKIGNYQDYLYKSNGKWYKKKYIGKVVLNGSESNWTYSSGWSKTNTNVFFNNEVVANALYESYNGIYGISSHFIVVSRNTLYNDDIEELSYSGTEVTNPLITIRINKNITENLATFKEWLSNNNLTYYYILATPNDIQITDTTLIEQLDNLYNAMSYNGTTNISSSGDLPMIMKVRALKGE